MNADCIGLGDWETIISRIKEGICIPFLGAGASLGQGLPTTGSLAKAIAEFCHYPCKVDEDLLRVAQYCATDKDPYALRKFIKDTIEGYKAKPGIVHNVIASLPFRYVLTTNYDDLMEKAFIGCEKLPRCEVYDPNGDRKTLKEATIKEPLVYKLHGSVEKVDTIIASENDFIDFLASLILSESAIPELIKQLLKQNSILFIGYGLKDWNVRSMLRAIRGTRIDKCSFAIQKKPKDPGEAKVWEKSVVYFSEWEKLRCFDIDAIDFVIELKKKYK